MGVRPFMTPVMPLSSRVCPMANKKPGKSTDHTDQKSNFTFSVLNFLRREMLTGTKNKQADKIRMAPTSPGAYTKSPFLIKIKLLPQIKESKINNSQGSTLGFFICAYLLKLLISQHVKRRA